MSGFPLKMPRPGHGYDTGQSSQYPDPEASQNQNVVWPARAPVPMQSAVDLSLDNARAEFATVSMEQRRQRREQGDDAEDILGLNIE